MNFPSKRPPIDYEHEYNARAMVPEHPEILVRWAEDSRHARRSNRCLLDLSYGHSADERLDFFPSKTPNAPLLVFIHGGWWRGLDKSDYSFVAPAFVSEGVNVALTNYTLAPQASLYDIVRQQLHALTWLYRNAKRFGYNGDRIVIAGHSAGGHLAAMMMAADWPVYGADLPQNLIKAGILMSGLYDLEPIPYADFVNVDLKLQPEDVPHLSPAWMPQSHPTPFVTAAGGLESAEFRRQTALIGHAWKDQHLGDVKVPHANHFTICDEFATSGRPLFEISKKLVSAIR
ncbi:MAG: alpha/beta hydrolase [Burkholderiales bacterium]|nr:alpha/beta hydrolase [Burkholderiales bacterium]